MPTFSNFSLNYSSVTSSGIKFTKILLSKVFFIFCAIGVKPSLYNMFSCL